MATKKRKGRIRQTQTEWQKAFNTHPKMVQWVSWSDGMPEVLHISITLVGNEYETVKADFYRIADFVNARHNLQHKFYFNLSHTVKLIKQDKEILDEIFKTSFKLAFELLLPLYYDVFGIETTNSLDKHFNFENLFIGYKQILDGRADASILCKYLMIQYDQKESAAASFLFNTNKREEILQPLNISNVMAAFPPFVAFSKNIDLEFCSNIWMFNYIRVPLMTLPDDSDEETRRFNEMNLNKEVSKFNKLFEEFKRLNLLALYPRSVAEINMGFVSRICNLTIDTVALVKQHKGEIAELTFRTILESFIVGSWLLKRNDSSLYQRFRDYSTGRVKFFGEKIIERVNDEAMKNAAKKMIADTIKEAGVRDIDVASERGEIFDLRIDQMADEVWGTENLYYNFYKRSSEVTHGHWRVIAKYHLAKSHNPMHNGLYGYNENPNRFAGLVPAFLSLGFASEFLHTIIQDIEAEEIKSLKENLEEFRKQNAKGWLEYYNKYVI